VPIMTDRPQPVVIWRDGDDRNPLRLSPAEALTYALDLAQAAVRAGAIPASL
jgi:hypothetical protein